MRENVRGEKIKEWHLRGRFRWTAPPASLSEPFIESFSRKFLHFATTPAPLNNPAWTMETTSSANDAIKHVDFLHNDLVFPPRLATVDNITSLVVAN